MRIRLLTAKTGPGSLILYRMERFLWFVLSITLLLSPVCQIVKPMSTYLPTNPKIEWHGRHSKYSPEEINLVGSASSVKFRFRGNKCIIWMASYAGPNKYFHHVS